jgi:hypothetical protein
MGFTLMATILRLWVTPEFDTGRERPARPAIIIGRYLATLSL